MRGISIEIAYSSISLEREIIECKYSFTAHSVPFVATVFYDLVPQLWMQTLTITNRAVQQPLKIVCMITVVCHTQ